MGNEHGEWEIEKWEQSRELEIKLLMGLGFKLGFVSTYPFPVLGPAYIEVGDQWGNLWRITPATSCKRDQIKTRDYYGQAGYPT